MLDIKIIETNLATKFMICSLIGLTVLPGNGTMYITITDAGYSDKRNKGKLWAAFLDHPLYNTESTLASANYTEAYQTRKTNE